MIRWRSLQRWQDAGAHWAVIARHADVDHGRALPLLRRREEVDRGGDYRHPHHVADIDGIVPVWTPPPPRPPVGAVAAPTTSTAPAAASRTARWVDLLSVGLKQPLPPAAASTS